MSESDLLKAAREADLEPEVVDAIAGVSRKDSSSYANRRFFLAILGVLPWVGVLITASISRWAEHDQNKANAMFRAWLDEHESRLHELEEVSGRIASQAHAAGPVAEARLNSDVYLPLVRHGFRVWDRSETAEKRELIRRVLTNAACDSLCSDDFVRRFIEWVDDYNELHFKIIRELYRSPRSTRADLWSSIHNEQVREDSAEADLFKLLIRGLSTGQVIRQARETDAFGNFYKKRSVRGTSSRMAKSAFDDREEYVLTDLGKNFVHYALNEVVPKLHVPKPGPTKPRSSDGAPA